MLTKILELAICLQLLVLASVCQGGVFNWTKPEQLNRGLPSSVQIFKLNNTRSPFGTKLTGGFARFNMNDSNLEFVVKDTNSDQFGYFPKTPEQYAEDQENVVYAVINGGFFDMSRNISASFIKEKGRVINSNTINSDDRNHPTIGAIGITDTATNSFEVEYIYSYQPDLMTYKFRYPNPYPGPEPMRDAGEEWEAYEGIGAGPILLKNRTIIKGNIENFNSTYILNMRHPRSAICYDNSHHLYFVAIDGRYNASDGLNITETAILMDDLFCVDAMNLDGGGSTLLFANNRIINRPSDPTGPRPVVSAILIRDKYKKKPTDSLQQTVSDQLRAMKKTYEQA